MAELNEAQKELIRRNLAWAGATLQEMGQKHHDFFTKSAEIFAMMGWFATQLGAVKNADEIMTLVKDGHKESIVDSAIRIAMEELFRDPLG